MKMCCILMLSYCLSTINNPILATSIENLQNQFEETKHFQVVKDIVFKKLKEFNIEIDDISNRNETNCGLNMLIIPHFTIKKDTTIEIIYDSVNPIDRAILFNKNKIIGSLLFTKSNDTIFCHKKLKGNTNFDCGKYMYREANYNKAIKILLKKKPVFIFKNCDYERIWFYLDKNRNLYVLTYDLETYLLSDFFYKENLLKYCMPNNVIIK